MSILRALSALVTCGALAACSVDNKDDDFQTVGVGDALGGLVAQRLGRVPDPVDARAVLSPQVLAAAQLPTMLVIQRLNDRGIAMAAVGTGADGTVQWRDGTGGGLLLRGGILVGTRGLGFDLHTVDEAGLRRALIAGGGQDARRVERRLRSDNVIVADRLFCDVVPVGRERLAYYGRTYATTLFEERCADGESDFTNRYWLGDDGAIRRQIVRVSPEAGDLETVLLRE